MFHVSRVALFAYVVLIGLVIGALLMPHLVTEYDAAAHILVFCLLMFWPAIVIADIRKTLGVALLMVVAGGGIEYLQRFSAERTASWGDFAMNALGVAIGLVSGLIARRIIRALG